MKKTAGARLLGVAMLVLLLNSCKKPEVVDVGMNAPAEVGYSDTLSVDLRVNLQPTDSLFTLNQSYMVLGNYNDPVVGRVSGEIYTQFSLAGEFVFFPLGATLDSIVLYLPLESYYGDVTSVMNLEVNELTDAFNTSIPYYASTNMGYDPTNLAAGATYSQAGNGEFAFDTLAIRLSNELGERLLAADINGPLANNQNFHQFFKGLRIAATPQNMGAVGAVYTVALRNLAVTGRTAASLRIFYSEDGEARTPYNMSVLAGISSRYNRLERTETAGTLLEQLLNRDQPQAAQQAVMQAVLPIRLSGKITNLPDERWAINRAILELPVDTTYIDNNSLTFFRPMPWDLLFMTAAPDSTNPDPLSGIESYANYNNSIRAYEFNVTAYLHQIQVDGSFPDYGFVILSPPYAFTSRGGVSSVGSTQRSVLTNRMHPTRPPRLRVFYTRMP